MDVQWPLPYTTSPYFPIAQSFAASIQRDGIAISETTVTVALNRALPAL